MVYFKIKKFDEYWMLKGIFLINKVKFCIESIGFFKLRGDLF